MRIARVFFPASVVLFVLTACSGSARNMHAALDTQIRQNAERHGIPAQAVLVLRNGNVLYRNTTGLADVETRRAVRPDDVYAAYSVSKLFMSTLIMQLVDEGRLDLDQPVSRYVPDLPPAWGTVRVHHLLNHSSGLPDFFDGVAPATSFPPTRDDVFRSLADRPLAFRPGAETRYGQTGYLLLQAILERIHGVPYREIVRTRITAPFGLDDTYLGLAHAPRQRLVSPYRGEGGRLVPDPTIPWQDYSIAHAELYTTPDDLGAFLTAVAQGKLVRRETLVRMWEPFRAQNGQAGFAAGWDYGESGRYTEVGLDGGVKVRVRLLFRDDDLSDHTIIVYLTNGARDNVWTRTLVESVQRIVLRD